MASCWGEIYTKYSREPRRKLPLETTLTCNMRVDVSMMGIQTVRSTNHHIIPAGVLGLDTGLGGREMEVARHPWSWVVGEAGYGSVEQTKAG